MNHQDVHRRHAVVYFDRKGSRAIVLAQHYNGRGGALVEDDVPSVVEGLTDTENLTSALREALARSSVRSEINLRDRIASDWPAYKASHAKSIRAFEADFIQVSIAGANEANVTYQIEGLPEPNAQLWVASSVSAQSPELGNRCLDVWRACRDRAL